MKNIAIIGAGLVGALQACYLSRKGHKVDVYESRGDFRAIGYIGGRSINLALSKRGWTALERVGLSQEIEKIAIPMYGRHIHQIDGTSYVQPYGLQEEAIYSVSRGELNKLLVSLADEFNQVDFHFNHYCKEIDFKNNRAIFEDQANQNKLVKVEADYFFGCDGAFSKVRQAMMQVPRFDFQQFYINYGYKELTIPSLKDGGFALEKNALHIWPRKDFMLIALPNLDGSFTCTLFVPYEGENAFDDLTNQDEVKAYFETYFSDVIPLMPNLVEDFFRNPTASLVVTKSNPWQVQNFLLMGDAAHAVVPFFGQGMNCGFEDVRIFDDMLDEVNDFDKVFAAFTSVRKENADAIAQMALDNFIEMRDKVADKTFIRYKKIENLLLNSPLYDYQSMYQMVSFTDKPYVQAYRAGQIQLKMLEELDKITHVEEKIDSLAVKEIVERYKAQYNS
ncbi:MAG: FAD-dependent monooxygenase [Chitinophagales bacterium]|jgi:kynurenine 3-monooxygenase|nr:FAD-dependent monooxygenase [Chitinophagales bacterium]